MRLSGVLLLAGLLVAACAPAAAPSGSAAPASAPAAASAASAGGAAAGAAPASASASAAPASAPAAAGAAAPTAAPLQTVRVGVPGPSLSYLPAYLAGKLGYLREEGIEVEIVQIGPTAMVPALMNRELDFTTLLSTVGTNALQGGPVRIVQFHSVKLQHVLVTRPDITSVEQLAGKRVGIDGVATLVGFEGRKLIERYNLRDAALVATGSELERIAALEAGAADAIISSIPANLIAERRGYPALLRMDSVIAVPQAGLGTGEAHLRERTATISGVLRAAARTLPLIPTQRDLVIGHIAEFVSLAPEDAARAYDQVQDTYARNGVPSAAQLAAYLDLLQSTAGAPADATVEGMADFTLARRVAAELGLPAE